jgi:predicted transcriptional regulator
MDASLGDSDATLLHHLVDGRPIHVGHLVELVNADNTPANKSLQNFSLKGTVSPD